jgi:GTP pyrophosphokinase
MHVDMGDEMAQDATDLRVVISLRDRNHLDLILRSLRRTTSVLSVVRVKPSV